MQVRFYGVRGSVPTPSASTVRYGGNTVCVEVRLADGTLLILDAGTGLRELGNDLIQRGEKLTDLLMFITHVHWDHILGLPFFAPVFRKDTVLRIHPMSNDVQQSAAHRRGLFDGVHFPVRFTDIPGTIDWIEGVDPFRIGSATVKRIMLNHPGGAQGFRIDDADGKSLAYLTDNELSPPGPLVTSLDDLARFASGVDMMIHDAQYVAADMPAKFGWGHSTIDDVLDLACKAEVKRLVPFHHNPSRSDDALDALEFESAMRMRSRGSATRVNFAREGWRLAL